LSKKKEKMRIEDLETNLKKRQERNRLQFTLDIGASPEVINEAEAQLGGLPEQVRLFYSHFNGLSVESPALTIERIEDLRKDNEGRIPFCRLGQEIILSFDATKFNEAGQWTIQNHDTSYIVTLTMASFWSNKIFGWLDRERHIWEPEDYV
jgi:hypothetical protein